MRQKSKYPKTNVCFRLRIDTLEKVDKIAEKKEMERGELLRKIVENYIYTVDIN